jgi:hypothetical protein
MITCVGVEGEISMAEAEVTAAGCTENTVGINISISVYINNPDFQPLIPSKMFK